ncbi:MAG: hypothetical protein KJN90_07325 [Gammaproteobacteria bacterium]|nr:hypothetical protein [Gammaproteobacteria bacterium]
MDHRIIESSKYAIRTPACLIDGKHLAGKRQRGEIDFTFTSVSAAIRNFKVPKTVPKPDAVPVKFA